MVHGSVNLVVASLKASHFDCKNELVGGKKNVLVPCLSRINVICFHLCFHFFFGKLNK